MSTNAQKSPTMLEFVGRNVALVWPGLNKKGKCIERVSQRLRLWWNWWTLVQFGGFAGLGMVQNQLGVRDAMIEFPWSISS